MSDETEPLVDPVTVAARMGIKNPDNDVLAIIEDQTVDSVAKVTAMLNRPIGQVARTLIGLTPSYGYMLGETDAWPQATAIFEDAFTVTTWTVDPETSLFTVTFSVGLDISDPGHPVRRFLAADVRAALRTDPDFCALAGIERVTSSESAGGQSISFADTKAANGQTTAATAGGAPDESMITPYRRYAIHQPSMEPMARWPYYQ